MFLLLCLAQKNFTVDTESWNKQTFLPRLSGEVAYHSHQMDAIKDQFLDSVNHIKPKFPKLKLYSTVTGNLIKDELQDANYWWRNLEAVLFSDALTHYFLKNQHILYK